MSLTRLRLGHLGLLLLLMVAGSAVETLVPDRLQRDVAFGTGLVVGGLTVYLALRLREDQDRDRDRDR